MRVTCGLAEEILASQEELRCLQSVVTLTPDTTQPDSKALHSVPAAYGQCECH